MRNLFALIPFAMTLNVDAETLSLSSFRIELDDGWVYDIESAPGANEHLRDRVSIFHPDGKGVLKMQSLVAPDSVSKEILRNMTNVDSATHLDWQMWGDYSGFQHNYTEMGSFYRQWWLVHGRTMVFVTYNSDTESDGIEIDEVNRIVSSISLP